MQCYYLVESNRFRLGTRNCSSDASAPPDFRDCGADKSVNKVDVDKFTRADVAADIINVTAIINRRRKR